MNYADLAEIDRDFRKHHRFPPPGWASEYIPHHNKHIPGTTRYQRSPEFQTWFAMIVRCCYSSHVRYEMYGGRGIKVSHRWLKSFHSFLEDMGKRPRGRTLDRRNVNGNYNKRNCRWATLSEQSLNRRRK